MIPVAIRQMMRWNVGVAVEGTRGAWPGYLAVVAASTEDSRMMDTWWSALVLWVLAVLVVGGVFFTLANSRVRTRARHAAHWWWQWRQTYGVDPIRAAHRVRSGQWPPRTC